MTSSDFNNVIMYDGHRANVRPRIVIFKGAEYDVVESQSLFISTGKLPDSPVKRGFEVRCTGGTRFKLVLTEGVGWEVSKLPGPALVGE